MWGSIDLIQIEYYLYNLGSVAEWLCRGLQSLAQRFDSAPSLQNILVFLTFFNYLNYLFSPVAQLVEQTAVNRWVAGSSPAWGAILLSRA